MMTTRRASKAQEAREEQLKVLQQIEQQRIVQKQQRDKDRKQAELEAKRGQDTESAERAALVQSQNTTVPAPSSQDQHDPDINRNLFDLNSNISDDSPDPTDRSPPSRKQHGTSGMAIARRVSPTEQTAPTNPGK